MKKTISLFLALLLLSVLCLTGCQKQDSGQTDSETQTGSQSSLVAQKPAGTQDMPEVKTDYGSSSQFSKEDLDAAIRTVQEEVSMWEGVSLSNIRYAGDEASTEKNLKWMNELDSSKNFTQVCEMISDIEVAENASAGPWEAGKSYKDYNWWLARTDGGEWSLMTWGYY